MEISLQLINEKGFVFHQYDFPRHLSSDVEVANFLSTHISDLIQVPNEFLHYDIDTLHQGDEIKPHFHMIPGSFQVVCWIPDQEFSGRDFLFGTRERLERFKPQKGWMCFMKPNDPNFIHGVSKLESDTPVKTIGFSSLFAPFEENKVYDIFVE